MCISNFTPDAEPTKCIYFIQIHSSHAEFRSDRRCPCMDVDARSRHESIKRERGLCLSSSASGAATVFLASPLSSPSSIAPTPPLSSLDGVDGGDECSGGHAKNDNSYYAAVASGLGLGYDLSS